MSQAKILLTSFQPWLAHHQYNSSDILLACLQASTPAQANYFFLRQLPVDTSDAWERTRGAIAHYNPDVILCCGMAETRDCLTLESQACSQGQRAITLVDLSTLVETLAFTKISHDAGKFVCEALYFQVLQYLQQYHPQTLGLFLHVPLIDRTNEAAILKDMRAILDWLRQDSIHPPDAP